MNQSTGTIAAAVFVLLVSGVAAWVVGSKPRPETQTEADIQALNDLGVPVTLEDLEALKDTPPVAAENYEEAGADFTAFLMGKGSGWWNLATSESADLASFKEDVEQLEPIFRLIELGSREKRFVPRQDVLIWETSPGLQLNRDYHNLTEFLRFRMRVLAATGEKERAFENISVVLRMAEQIAGFPGDHSNGRGAHLQRIGYEMAKELSARFPEDQRLQLKLLVLVELSRPIELRPSFQLRPAIAFLVLDSEEPLPKQFVPTDYVASPMQTVTPQQIVEERVNSKKVRQEAKALVARHYLNLFEDFPEDPTDSQAIARLTQLDANAPSLSVALAEKFIQTEGSNRTHKERMDAIESVRARLDR